ncbi:hypothetical protein FPOA_10680 [Fusarium poae]|uniref:Uncharacterized protein n=1 Tax=Fusarium poae TaxID=36050 RepID=A0A1B8AEQ0_FUSPO|nr:hypothetical protein FPOA_10680 [Fusarium poae]
MVRLSIFAIAAAVITGVVADTRACQCLFQDGSHCCVNLKTGPCDVGCRTSGRKGTACNANGKFVEISWFTGVGRTKCDF